jgi:hypothetical protein
MKAFRRLAAALALAASVSACGQSLSPGDRQSIRSTTVNRNVAVTPDLLYSGPAQLWLNVLGPVGALAGQVKGEEPKAAIRATLAKNQIDLGTMAADEFARQATASRVLPIVTSGGESEVRLEVPYWGLWLSSPVGVQMKPLFGIRAKIVRSDGRVVWEKYYWIAQMNGETPSATLETYLENPELLRKAFAAANEIVVRELIADLRG